MNRRTILKLLAAQAVPRTVTRVQARTAVEIAADRFLINGRPTYAGRTWNGKRIEGLLLNSRMVQGTFDDLNPDDAATCGPTRTRRRWDPERNTREFLAAMPEWRQHGLLAFTLNLQGGSPQGYSKDQPWHNSAFNADGALRPEYLRRLERDPRQGRRAGHGRHPRHLLLRPGRAARRTRRRSSARVDERDSTGCSTRATATC